MRIDVIVNTTAHRFRRQPELLDRIERVATGKATLHRTGSVEELGHVVRALAERGTDVVVLSGGDGSFMAGVTALSGAFNPSRLPKIAFIPGGTVATVARNWGRVGDPAALLSEIVDAKRHDAVARPTLRVRHRRATETSEKIGFIFGTGLVAKFFQVYYAEGARGYAGAARIVARIFAESFVGGAYARRVLDPLPCTSEVDGTELGPRAWSLVCASVVRDLGIHMLVTYRAGEDPDRPHLVASALPTRSLGPRAPLVLAGRSIGGKDHFDDLVQSFTVRFPKEETYVLDGDVLGADEVTVSAGPRIDVIALSR